jgi:hypothetical protein
MANSLVGEWIAVRLKTKQIILYLTIKLARSVPSSYTRNQWLKPNPLAITTRQTQPFADHHSV